MTRADLLSTLQAALSALPRAQRFHPYRTAGEIADLCSLGYKPVGLMLSKLAREGYVERLQAGPSGTRGDHLPTRYRLSEKGWLVP